MHALRPTPGNAQMLKHLLSHSCSIVPTTGQLLASSGDSGEMVLWRPASAEEAQPKGNLVDDTCRAPWRVEKSLRWALLQRGHWLAGGSERPRAC